MTVNPKHLQELAAGLNELASAIDQIARSLGEQLTPAPVPKKVAPKKPAAKRKPAKAKAKKSAKKPTKMDVILQTIRRARKGLSVAELRKRTGYSTRTVNNSIYKLKKAKRIQSPKRGVYIKI